MLGVPIALVDYTGAMDAMDGMIERREPGYVSAAAVHVVMVSRHDPETRAALDLIFSDHFSRNEPGIFTPLRDMLLTNGDFYMHLADLTSYVKVQEELGTLYADRNAWAHKAVLNVASSGKFSSDRTISEYAAGIWNVKPCPVP